MQTNQRSGWGCVFDLRPLLVRSAMGARLSKEQDAQLRAARDAELEKKKEVAKALMKLRDEKQQRVHELTMELAELELTIESARHEVRKFQEDHKFALAKYEAEKVSDEEDIDSSNEASWKRAKSDSGTTNTRADMLTDAADIRTSAFIKLDSLQSKLGKFSYYLMHGKLQIHLEDEISVQNEDAITAAAGRIARRYLQNEDHVTIEVSSQSLNGMLCAPKIGSKLTVNNCFQTAGMYVVYGGVLHWVSVAHYYVPPTCFDSNQARIFRDQLQVATEEIALRKVKLDYSDEQLIAADDNMVLIPMPYACLRHKPKDRMGRTLLNSVDIMIGQVPMVLIRHEAREPENLVLLNEVRDDTEPMYKINRVWRPTRFCGGEHNNFSRYGIPEGIKHDNYRNLIAMLPGNNLAEGIVISDSGIAHLSGVQFDNVLVILPRNGITPRLGDSGSIWVARDSSEAVAITVGKVAVRDQSFKEAWVATLLFPCLEMLCLQHEHTFSAVSLFSSPEGQALVDD